MAKHYAVHSGPEKDRHRFDAITAERDLYETYLPQFERVVREGHVGGVMSAYNSLNGVPCSANPFLLTDVLRKQWGFDGYVVSDCDAIRDIWRPQDHHYSNSPEEAAAAAVKAGCDLCCGGDYNALVRAVQSRLISVEQVDAALYRTLQVRLRLGMFDPPEVVPYSKYTLKDNDTPEHSLVALDLARQSLVLLKNDGILPLNRSKYKRIAVIGANADSKSMLLGNYHGSASHPITILDGIRRLAGPGIQITTALGSAITPEKGQAPWSGQDNTTDRPRNELSAEAIKVAMDADLTIYVGGITAGQEGESFDRSSIELPETQETLIRALYATGKPVVMVNCSGSAIALTWEDEHLPAILQAWYPGQNGGQAVAEALFGEINPSGHLPVTFYRSLNELPPFTDYSMANRTYRYFQGRPLYAFGHGLSYTHFEYSDGKIEADHLGQDGTIILSFTVKNAGERIGDDVPQVYVRHVRSDVPQPKSSLCGFTRLAVNQGASAGVTLAVPVTRLRFWSVAEKRYVIEPGQYELLVGRAADDIRLTLPFSVGPDDRRRQ